MSPRINRQSGFTLLEILIVITIMAIATGLVATFVGNSFNAYGFLQAKASTSSDANLELDRVSRVIRGATQVLNAGTNSLTVYAYFSPRDNAPDQVNYYVSGTSFLAAVIPASGTAPNYTYNVANQQNYTLITHLTNGAQVAFTYYDDQGNQLTGAFSTIQVKQISIYLATNPYPNVLHVPVVIQTTDTLRNLKTNL